MEILQIEIVSKASAQLRDEYTVLSIVMLRFTASIIFLIIMVQCGLTIFDDVSSEKSAQAAQNLSYFWM